MLHRRPRLRLVQCPAHGICWGAAPDSPRAKRLAGKRHCKMRVCCCSTQRRQQHVAPFLYLTALKKTLESVMIITSSCGFASYPQAEAPKRRFFTCAYRIFTILFPRDRWLRATWRSQCFYSKLAFDSLSDASGHLLRKRNFPQHRSSTLRPALKVHCGSLKKPISIPDPIRLPKRIADITQSGQDRKERSSRDIITYPVLWWSDRYHGNWRLYRPSSTNKEDDVFMVPLLSKLREAVYVPS